MKPLDFLGTLNLILEDVQNLHVFFQRIIVFAFILCFRFWLCIFKWYVYLQRPPFNRTLPFSSVDNELFIIFIHETVIHRFIKFFHNSHIVLTKIRKFSTL